MRVIREVSTESSIGVMNLCAERIFSWIPYERSIESAYRTAQKKEPNFYRAEHFLGTPYIYIYIYIRARASIKHEKLPSASARAHKCPDPSTKHIRTHMTAKANKERALATSNAATASACAPLYVSQGRHVRLRTTYLYLCCFVHDRPDARTFPSAEIGRPASRVSRRFTERPNPSFLLSSGSSPRRVMAHWLIDWTLLRPDDLTLNSFYSRIRAMCILD